MTISIDKRRRAALAALLCVSFTATADAQVARSVAPTVPPLSAGPASDRVLPPAVRPSDGPGPRGEPEVDCAITGTGTCQNMEFPRVGGTSLVSNGPANSGAPFRVADQFRTDGSQTHLLSQLCWWGAYSSVTACAGTPPADAFTIRIYNRVNAGPNAGIPDAVGAPVALWSQSAGSLTVTRRQICQAAAPIVTYEYTATVTTPVSLAPGTCYFLEITNSTNGATSWFWSRASFPTDGRAFQDATSNGYVLSELLSSNVPPTFSADRAFCLDIALDLFSPGSSACLPPTQSPPANDACDAAALLTLGGPTISGDTTLATRDDALPCGAARENQGRGVWFRVVGDGNAISVSTCAQGTTFNTRLSVYCGTDCSDLNCVDGNDDDQTCTPGTLRSTVTFCSEAGRTYFVLLHGFAGAAGAYEIGAVSDGSPCIAGACVPCLVTAPPEALEENEPCGPAQTNGGCNTQSPPQPFTTPIACGQTYHGSAWASGGARDTDWYLLTLATDSEVNVTLAAEFPAVSFIIAYADLSTCTGPTFPGGLADPDPCSTETYTTFLTAGEYIIFVAVGSLGGGDTFEGVPCRVDSVATDYVLSVDCVAACPGIAIPPNTPLEHEPCGSDLNGGCNNADPGGAPLPATFETACGGTTVHGTSFALNGTRDTDWYQVTATPTGEVGVEVTPAFPALVLILDIVINGDGTCGASTVVGAATVAGCTTVAVSAAGLVPGAPYGVFIAPGNASGGLFDGMPCAQDYLITFTSGECAPSFPCCDVNHDHLLNSQDFFDFIAAFFSSLPSSDFNGDGQLNSQDFFDFLVCFFQPAPGCP